MKKIHFALTSFVLSAVAACGYLGLPTSTQDGDLSNVDSSSNDSLVQGNAWFTDRQSVTACFEVEPDFGLSAAEAKREISEAWVEWRGYLYLRARETAARLPFDMDLEEGCEPWGIPSYDLSFYLGSRAGAAQTARDHSTSSLMASYR